MRLRIVHSSRYSYSSPVTTSLNEARLTPMATPWQIPLESAVSVEAATWEFTYFDYWGTQVRYFEAQRSHEHLLVEARSTVEVDESRLPAPRDDLAWADLRVQAVRDGHAEFLAQVDATRPDEDLADLADDIAASLPPYEAALAVCEHVHDAMTYLPGSTGVHTAAAEAWESGSGVCQDYAHLVVGALRHIGIPARYVSGYLHPKREPVIGDAVVGESHAWAEWWLGDWYGYDPTNNGPLSARHVLVGRGRDYADVPPIKGIIAGGSSTTDLDVSVEVTRLA